MDHKDCPACLNGSDKILSPVTQRCHGCPMEGVTENTGKEPYFYMKRGMPMNIVQLLVGGWFTTGVLVSAIITIQMIIQMIRDRL